MCVNVDYSGDFCVLGKSLQAQFSSAAVTHISLPSDGLQCFLFSNKAECVADTHTHTQETCTYAVSFESFFFFFVFYEIAETNTLPGSDVGHLTQKTQVYLSALSKKTYYFYPAILL